MVSPFQLYHPNCVKREAEYRALYKAAGFKLTKAIKTPSPKGMTIIEGQAGMKSAHRVRLTHSV